MEFLQHLHRRKPWLTYHHSSYLPVLGVVSLRVELKLEPHLGVFDKGPRSFHVLISVNEPSDWIVY